MNSFVFRLLRNFNETKSFFPHSSFRSFFLRCVVSAWESSLSLWPKGARERISRVVLYLREYLFRWFQYINMHRAETQKSHAPLSVLLFRIFRISSEGGDK